MEEEKKFNWLIVVGEKDFFSVTAYSVRIFGDTPEYTLSDVQKISDVWDKIDKSNYELSQIGAGKLKQEILNKIKDAY